MLRDQDLDVSLMRKAAALLVGTHDFSSFRTSKCQATSPVKTLESLKVEVDDGRHYWPMRYLGDEVTRRRNLLVTATARSFLYHQVRLMVGLLRRWVVGRFAWRTSRRSWRRGTSGR